MAPSIKYQARVPLAISLLKILTQPNFIKNYKPRPYVAKTNNFNKKKKEWHRIELFYEEIYESLPIKV